MKRILLSGATGRMGKEISTLLESDKDFELACGLSLEKAPGIKNKISDVPAKSIDIVIDFSSPKFALDLVKWCVENKKPLVSGTTGFTDSEFKAFTANSKKIPMLYSSNTSVGVAVLRRAMKALGLDFQLRLSDR
jgi:4-hydroxy-tetrahydrodipicolinate reductase